MYDQLQVDEYVNFSMMSKNQIELMKDFYDYPSQISMVVNGCFRVYLARSTTVIIILSKQAVKLSIFRALLLAYLEVVDR
jgi:hypothetical protein